MVNSEVNARSYLRQREAWFRKHPLHDSHVRAFLMSYPPTWRGLWTCPRCGRELRRLDVPRDSDGRLKKHCGCRTNMISGQGRWQQIGVDVRSAEFKRAARIMGLAGYKQPKLDQHVKEWKAKKRNDQKAHNIEKYCTKKYTEKELYQRSLERVRKRDIENVKQLKDKYIKHLIVKSMPLLKHVKIPQSLIDLERMRLMLVREIEARKTK